MRIEIKQMITEGIVDSAVGKISSMLQKKKAFKIESTPSDIAKALSQQKKLASIREQIKKTKHQLDVVKMHQKVIDRVKLTQEDQTEKPIFKSSKVINKDPKNPYRPYIDNA